MIEINREEYLVIEGECGAKLEVEKYKIIYPKSPFNCKDGKLTICVNDCESVTLNKTDAYVLAKRILDLLELEG